MKITKKQEPALRTKIQDITAVLKAITPNESVDFVTEEADSATLRVLRTLQREIADWSFTR